MAADEETPLPGGEVQDDDLIDGKVVWAALGVVGAAVMVVVGLVGLMIYLACRIVFRG